MLSFAPSPATAVLLLGEIGNAEAGGLPRYSEHGCGGGDGRAQGQVVLLQILVCHHCCVWASALLPPWRLQVPLAAVAFPIHVSQSVEPQTPSRAKLGVPWRGKDTAAAPCLRQGRGLGACCPCLSPHPAVSLSRWHRWASPHLGAGRQMDPADRSFSCSVPGL